MKPIPEYIAMADSPVFSSAPETPEAAAGRSRPAPSPAGESRNWELIAADLWRDIPEPPKDNDLVRMRELLFAREITLVDRLRVAVGEKRRAAEMVGEVLAESVALRGGEGSSLSMAFEPLVDGILKKNIRKRRHELVNALFPLMGPSIRRAIAETFRSMLGSFSKSVEMAFSWRGLRWRFQAWRSGKSFSEIVMLNTLVYRVEQVFFVHSDTGLVLSHLVNEGVGSHDADMVSAMLTAIQDFVRDCFTAGGEGDLESLQFGEFTIYIEKDAQAYLACVVRGTPPASLRTLLRETLELMLVEFADRFDSFDGDATHFNTATRFLDGCMLSYYADDDKALPLWAKALPALLVLLAFGTFGAVQYRDYRIAEETARFQRHMRDALRILRDEPGLMIIHVDDDEVPWQVMGFKDVLAREPEAVLRENNVDPSPFAFKTVPFISYDSSIVARRARTGITLPDTVTMSFDDGTLRFLGTAPLSWIVRARDLGLAIPGVERVDASGVHDPAMARLLELAALVEGSVIEFPFGKDIPLREDLPRLQKAVDALVELDHLARDMGFTTSLTIYGHADQMGLEKRNYEISQARTRTVAAMLYAKGASIPIAMYGMGSKYPAGGKSSDTDRKKPKEDQASRRIELRVHLAQSVSEGMESVLQYNRR